MQSFVKRIRTCMADLASLYRALVFGLTRGVAISCAALLVVCVVFVPAFAATKNTSHIDPEYEVLSFKVLEPNTSSRGEIRHTRRLELTNVTLKRLIGWAFSVQEGQIAGTPEWAASARFDIVLKTDHSAGGTLAADQRDRRRVQMLLADRFGLSFHWEERELMAWALDVAGDGPRFKESARKDDTWLGVALNSGQLVGRGAPMIRVAEALSRELGHTVIDCTELEGIYDLQAQWVSKTGGTMRWKYGGWQPEATVLFPITKLTVEEALPAQLGLFLEYRKVPTVTVVVDEVYQPSGT